MEVSSDPARNPYCRYGVNNSNREEVAVYVDLVWAFTAVDALRGEHRPAPSSILDPGDVFVDLTIGCDLGTCDSLLVAAPGDRRRDWATIIATYRRRIAEYEAAVGSFRTFDDLFAALDALQHPLNEDGSSPTSIATARRSTWRSKSTQTA